MECHSTLQALLFTRSTTKRGHHERQQHSVSEVSGANEVGYDSPSLPPSLPLKIAPHPNSCFYDSMPFANLPSRDK